MEQFRQGIRYIWYEGCTKLIGTNCGYSNHKFEKKGTVLDTWNDGLFGREYSKLQEMECKNCGITTYYLVNAEETNWRNHFS